MSSPARGQSLAQKAIAAARSAHDDEALVVALRAAAWASRELFEHRRAGAYLNEGLQVARRLGDGERTCEVLITRSALNLELGHVGRSRRDLERARASAPPSALCEIAFAEGVIDQKIGDFVAASKAYEHALDLSPDDRPDLTIKALNNRALVDMRLGDYRQSETHLLRAAQIAEPYSPAFTAIIAHNRANLAIAWNRPIDGLRRYEHAERLLSAAQLPLTEHYLDKAHGLFSLHLLREAADAADQAIHELERPGGALMLGEALLLRADVSRAEHDLDRARTVAQRAEGLFRSQRRRGWRARSALLRLQIEWASGGATLDMLRQIGNIERTTRQMGNVPATTDAALLHGQVAAALGHRRRAVAALRRAAAAARGPVLLRVRGRLAVALEADLVGDHQRMYRACHVGLEEVSSYRAAFASAEMRARVASHGAALADVALQAAARSRRAEHVWLWLERARTAVTVHNGAHEMDDAIRAEVAQVRALERDLAAVAPSDTTRQVDLLRTLARMERRISHHALARQAHASTVVVPSLPILRRLRADLGDRVLLEFGVIGDRLVGVGVTRDHIRFHDLGSLARVRGARQQLAFALTRLSRPRSGAAVAGAFGSAHTELAQLAEILTAPFAGAIAGVAEVIVAPPAELIGVPWGALPSLTDRPTRIVPSATIWSSTRQHVPRSDRVVLVAGPDLPSAPVEVREIARFYPGAQHLTAEAATTDAVRSAASGAGMVHMSCHGRLRADSAAFSSLRLADGPLTVHEIEMLAEPAHHWVLAACDLGRPGQLAGSELDGVLATLLHGGAGGVVAAVVSVPDLETRALMTALHGALSRGASLAGSVHHARGQLDTAEPAGFVASVAFSCYGGG
jgi:tetratricopeptide (TPR) repeat protein